MLFYLRAPDRHYILCYRLTFILRRRRRLCPGREEIVWLLLRLVRYAVSAEDILSDTALADYKCGACGFCRLFLASRLIFARLLFTLFRFFLFYTAHDIKYGSAPYYARRIPEEKYHGYHEKKYRENERSGNAETAHAERAEQSSDDTAALVIYSLQIEILQQHAHLFAYRKGAGGNKDNMEQ